MLIPEFLSSQRRQAGHNLSLAVGIGTLAGFLLILQAWCLAQIVDGVVFAGQGLKQLLPWFWALLMIFLVRALLAWSAEQIAFQAAVQVKLAVRDRLYRHIQRLGPAFLNDQRSGDLVNTLSDGIEALEAYYARYLPAVSLMALVPLSILAFVFPLDWISALVMLVTAPLIPLFMILIGKGAERRNQRQWRQLARMSAHFLDVIQGLTSLKLFNASRREAAVIARVSDDYRSQTLSVLRVAFLSSFALEFFSTLSIAIVAVLIGFRLYWGEMEFFHGFFVLLLAPEFYLPLRNMGSHYHARMEAIGAAQRMVEILVTPIPVEPKRQRLFARTPKEISLERVSFNYPDGRIGVEDLSFQVRPGETLALVGPSGAGKSTILNLLLGFLQPQAGVIRIAGRHLAEIDPADWRRCIALLPQRPTLFPMSLQDNIRLARPDAGLQEIQTAARLARADDFIERLPQGYRTRVGEGGRRLSGGQVQRIALARAFLKDAPLVLLDEATANLDLQSETLIRQAIETLARGRTLIMVAHRLGTVQRLPRILVLDRGRLVEQGSHAELLQHQGLYAKLASAYGAT
jgi:ATP-binding cassette subfamily C protein CydD